MYFDFLCNSNDNYLVSVLSKSGGYTVLKVFLQVLAGVAIAGIMYYNAINTVNVHKNMKFPKTIEGMRLYFPEGFMKDNTSGKWRMTYLGWMKTGERLPLLAQSDDGLHWKPYDTSGVTEIEKRQLPNQLFPIDKFGEWPACYVDPHAPEEHRL